MSAVARAWQARLSPAARLLILAAVPFPTTTSSGQPGGVELG